MIPLPHECFHGHISVTEHAGGLVPTRLPAGELSLYPSPEDMLIARSRAPSGVRLRFATDSSRLRLELLPTDTGAEQNVMDITRDGELLASERIGANHDSVEFGLPTGGESVYDLWLHQFHPITLLRIGVDDSASFSPAPDDRRRWLTYGSSITMCRAAASPARTWPAVAARALGLNVLNLGFGGQCHLEPMIARLIRDTPADIMTFELGINVHGGSSLGHRTYPSAVIGLVKIVRERHPHTPIGVITPIVCPGREYAANAVDCTLRDYRTMTAEAVKRLQETGDEQLMLFDGTELLGESETHLLTDGVHPGPEGYEMIGERVAASVLPRLLEMRR